MALPFIDLISPITALFASSLFEFFYELIRLTLGYNFILASLQQQDWGFNLASCVDGAPIVVQLRVGLGGSTDELERVAGFELVRFFGEKG